MQCEKGQRRNKHKIFLRQGRVKTIQYTTCFFHHAEVPFNVTHLKSFKWMVEVVGWCGSLQASKLHELRVSLLKKAS